jgi:hypothetical protein
MEIDSRAASLECADTATSRAAENNQNSAASEGAITDENIRILPYKKIE